MRPDDLHEQQEWRRFESAVHGSAPVRQDIVTPQRGLLEQTGGWPGVQVIPTIAGRQARVRRSGVVEAFVNTVQRWRLDEEQQLTLLGLGWNASFGRAILNGRLAQLPHDVRDRVGYILAITVGLSALFNESEEAELEWLQHPHRKLAGQSPLQVMLNGRMKNLMDVDALVSAERAG